MTYQEFKQHLLTICDWVDDETLDKILEYKKLLETYNKQMNLSRLVSDDLFYDQYFLSSLLPFSKLKYFHKDVDVSLLDIGTGSGIPGVVLKLVYPQLKVTLVEANTKKCQFLKVLITSLNLNDVVIINQRCEDYINNHRETFDIVTSRAVSSLNKILELSAAFSKVNGHIIALKSQNYLTELNEADNAIKILHLSLAETISYNFANHTHVILDFIKTDVTDECYPRSWKKIILRPL